MHYPEDMKIIIHAVRMHGVDGCNPKIQPPFFWIISKTRTVKSMGDLNLINVFFSSCFLGCIKRYSSLPYFGFTPPTQDVWMCFYLVLFLTDSTVVNHRDAISTIWENIFWFTFAKQFKQANPMMLVAKLKVCRDSPPPVQNMTGGF